MTPADPATRPSLWDPAAVVPRRSLILYAIGAVLGLIIAGYGLFTAQGTRVGGIAPENAATVNGAPILRADLIQQVGSLYSISFAQASAAQRRKALDDMAEEGVTQVFYPEIGSNWIIGVVGQLQLDVLLSRLDAEYKVAAGLEPAPFDTARWITAEDPADLKAFMDLNRSAMAKDRDDNPVFLAKSAWEVGYVADRYPKVRFLATRER